MIKPKIKLVKDNVRSFVLFDRHDLQRIGPLHLVLWKMILPPRGIVSTLIKSIITIICTLLTIANAWGCSELIISDKIRTSRTIAIAPVITINHTYNNAQENNKSSHFVWHSTGVELALQNFKCWPTCSIVFSFISARIEFFSPNEILNPLSAFVFVKSNVQWWCSVTYLLMILWMNTSCIFF